MMRFSAAPRQVIILIFIALLTLSCQAPDDPLLAGGLVGEELSAGGFAAEAMPSQSEQPAEAVAESAPAPLVTSFWDMEGVDTDTAVELLFAALSPEARLAQLFMLTYNGTNPGPGILSWFNRFGLGGIKIFGWNAENTTVLAAAIRQIYRAADKSPLGIPPFIATDQEGGWIRHVKGGTSVTPGNMAIGAAGTASDAYTSALYIGRELAALGIHMNFGPAVDLATRPDSTIIGPRAFSYDPVANAILSAAWSRGMHDAGVIATAKHFPGHGDTELDSHGVLPVIMIDKKLMQSRELIPYKLLIAEGIPAIMSGHLAYPLVSGSDDPASLSRVMVHDLLRTELAFDGLIITDDLMMTGAYSEGGLANTVIRAKSAGNDILMFSAELSTNSPSWLQLLRLYQTDSAMQQNIDASVRRVLRAKLEVFLPRGREGLVPLADLEQHLSTPESRRFFLEQAMRSVSPLNAALFRPLPASGRLLFAGPYSDFFRSAAARFPGSSAFSFGFLPTDNPASAELEAFRARIRSFDTVVVCVANAAGAGYVRAAQAAGKQVYIVSILSPWFALEFRNAVPGVAVYSFAADSFVAAMAVLAGDYAPVGSIPLDFSESQAEAP
ncbi:MAG: glycoside hydrolase family 3 protein [Spirochaetes bacterium]|nr:glycoside hydrolase family 3 protein [Spirochaetota bacterium]MBU0956058.1 glycoside hydrolase family 3 protein [Spirochaetota bacterium]